MYFHAIDLHLDSFLDHKLYLNDKNEVVITNKKYFIVDKSFEKFKKSLSKDDYVIVKACSNYIKIRFISIIFFLE